VTDMLDLSRPRAPDLITLDAVRVAREVVELTSRSGRANTDVDVKLEAPRAAFVRADSAQLRQLVWNLVRNAVQASSADDEVLVRLDVDRASGHLLLSV